MNNLSLLNFNSVKAEFCKYSSIIQHINSKQFKENKHLKTGNPGKEYKFRKLYYISTGVLIKKVVLNVNTSSTLP